MGQARVYGEVRGRNSGVTATSKTESTKELGQSMVRACGGGEELGLGKKRRKILKKN